jgi:hypothetical protein
MTRRHAMLFAATPALAAAQILPQFPPGTEAPIHHDDGLRLPNGKLQRDEILKAEYKKSLADSKDLVKLATDLHTELEKNDQYVLSLSAIKKTEEIEKLARRIRERIKRL